MKPFLAGTTQSEIQNQLHGLYKLINKLSSLVKYFYPLRQVASGYIGADGTVYNSYGLRDINPVVRVSTGLYDVFLDEYIDYTNTIILLIPIGIGNVLRSTSYSIKSAPDNNGITVKIVGHDAFDSPIVVKDTVFQFMVWQFRD